MAEFDLRETYRNTFGYDAPAAFALGTARATRQFSNLGQKYYDSDLLGREFFLPVRINGMLIPFAVISMTWKKVIVSTQMPERSGSVHEVISTDDYTFNIKGLLVNEDDQFPEQDVIDMHNLFKINTSVSLRSALSDIVLSGEFDHRVIIKEMKWPASAGVEHVKAFEIDVESDQIFELIIN